MLIVRELIFLIKHFIGMHDTRTLLEILQGFLKLPRIDLEDTPVEVVIFLVEDIFFVVIGFLSLLLICCVVTFVSPLRGTRSCFKLAVELLYFFLIEVADVLVFILLFLVLLLLYPEPEVVPLRLAPVHCSVLLFAPSDGSYFVGLGSLRRRDHLGVVMEDA